MTMPTGNKSEPKWTTTAALSTLCLVCGLTVAQIVRAGLASDFSRAQTKRDVYALPSPTQAKFFSLGYRSALAELIFAHVLVDSGLHLQQKRRFDTLAAYLKTVIELDPKYATPYRMADTLLTFQVGKPLLKNYNDAKAILTRGMRELPYDQELHLTAGQFMAYLAAPQIAHLAGEEEASRWRLDGARALARSCELVGHNEAIPYHCIAAAKLFEGAGEREAVKKFLQKVLAVNDDESIRALALGFLGRTLGAGEEEEAKIRFGDLEHLKKSDLPFVSKNRYLLLPPPFDPIACVGMLQSRRVECATSIVEWHARKDTKLE
jgi:tetratricopeptide (TPR) repeat protein